MVDIYRETPPTLSGSSTDVPKWGGTPRGWETGTETRTRTLTETGRLSLPLPRLRESEGHRCRDRGVVWPCPEGGRRPLWQ